MIPFSTLLLRSYYQAIGWNQDNTYSNLTRSSAALLDFQIPQSLVLQLANNPTPIFFTSYSLDALPQLNGAISYITTSEAIQGIGPSKSIPFRDVVERFRIYPPPRKPLPKDEIWLGGRRIEGRDYLLYSRLHLPSLHLSGLAVTRLTPTLQAHLAFLSQPQPRTTRPTSPNNPYSHSHSHSRQPSEVSNPVPAPPGNVLLSLQHDTGRYSGEYTYSAQDGMFGLRGLYNFGWKGDGEDEEERSKEKDKRIDEEEMMEGGLRGRFSAGGEVYFSAKQRSFGISTGVRFTTIPPILPIPLHSPPPSPPTTLTLLYNPLIGFISSAYSAQISPTVAVSSRFGVNVYSYESDLSIGGEWWIGRRRGKKHLSELTNQLEPPLVQDNVNLRPNDENENFDGHIKDISQNRVGNTIHEKNKMETEDRDGVLRARISGTGSLAVLYEARIKNCLVSIGAVSDFTSRQRPIRSVGLEVQYYS
ncbi:mitochondrial distribution and morphology protein 10 [Tremella mesenterica]|uniref:Mitochondrial distribution and morphology protein 10 n=1 Tax=Tremella mesenterica TaxID=5217 RepID=A0A4Q1BQ83_TREME|nr:mitochondrial distribution and morphology protein 10 [Tremella mesenterica]